MQHDFLQAEYSHQSHVARFYSILKNPWGMERDASQAKFMAISREVSPASLLGVCWLLPDSSRS
jgi:hypothetical protein